MIVKNEEKDIVRCLESVIPHIDYWVIFDTGSTDNTIQVIKDFMKKNKKPGELHESEWKDFSTNRNEVLEIADKKADFTLCMDADDYMKVNGNIKNMVGPGHQMYIARFVMNGSMQFDRSFMFKNGLGIRYTGVLHEYLVAPDGVETKTAKLTAVVINASSSPLKREASAEEKYKKDAEVLLKENERNPGDPRTLFYLAQSYRDANMNEEALKYYKERIEAGGWDQEVYYSRHMVAMMMDRLKYPEHQILDALLDAWDFRPFRLEAIYEVVKRNRLKGRYRTAYSLSAAAMGYFSKFGGNDNLFVTSEIEAWLMLDEYCINAFYCGEYDVAYINTNILMQSSQWQLMPKDEQDRIKRNMESYTKRYEESKKDSTQAS